MTQVEEAEGGTGSPFTIEGMEVHVFDYRGKIQDIWMLRWEGVGGREMSAVASGMRPN